jgi:hypothetical protein
VTAIALLYGTGEMKQIISAAILRLLSTALTLKASTDLALTGKGSAPTVSVKVIAPVFSYDESCTLIIFTILCIGVNTFLNGVPGIVTAMAIVLHMGWAIPGNQKYYTF